MSDPYVGEIRMFAGNFPPLGWAFCNGETMSIAENATLFNLIGTTYGGDGVNTFALPDLQGRFPIHQGNGAGLSSYIIGQLGGVERVAILTAQMPAHTHTALASGGGNAASPANAYWSTDPGGNTAAYNEAGGSSMASGAVKAAGSGQPHENRQPYLGVSFIISLFGIFPSQG
jgi:microcystin-dependent protein